MSYAKGSLLAAALVLVGSLAFADEPWPERYVNNQPAEGDLVLPMPCGGSMVFRRIDVPSSRILDDYRVIVGSHDPDRAYMEHSRPAFISAPFGGEREGERFYYLGKYEVTHLQWQAFDPTCPEVDDDGWLPVTEITWGEAAAFAERYSGWLWETQPDALPMADEVPGFLRLPTEAEWEYAARGGAAVPPSAFQAPLFPMTDAPARYVWYDGVDSSNRELNVTGLLKPNPLGLHDILGNVAEFAADPFRLVLVGRTHGRAGGFVKRGGDYRTSLANLHSGLREEFAPLGRRGLRREATTGFRLALVASSLTSRDAIATIRADWTVLAAEIEAAAAVEERRDDPVEEARLLADEVDHPEIERRLLDLARVIETNIALRNEERARAARERLRAAVFVARYFDVSHVPTERRCAQLRDMGVETWANYEERCARAAEAFARDGAYYVDMLLEIGAEYRAELLAEQASILRSEFQARGNRGSVTAVIRVVDDVALLKDGGTAMLDAVIDGWRQRDLP